MVIAEKPIGERRVLGLFGRLLEYPHSGVADMARECSALVAPESPEAAELLGEFAAFADRTPQTTLEEVFTATFDLNASCHAYVGYHMFGEDYRRSTFLLELKERFRKYDFDCGIELPDHLAVLLRFISVCPDEEMATEIVREALLPTLEPMTVAPEPEAVIEGEEPPPEVFDVGDEYRRVLRALRLILEVRYGLPQELQPIPLPDQERLVS